MGSVFCVMFVESVLLYFWNLWLFFDYGSWRVGFFGCLLVFIKRMFWREFLNLFIDWFGSKVDVDDFVFDVDVFGKCY